MKIKTITTMLYIFVIFAILTFTVALLLLSPAHADMFIQGFLVKQEDGSIKACYVVSNKQAICWDMYGPARDCVPITPENPKLICDYIEVKKD
jgi:hypothetical protein